MDNVATRWGWLLALLAAGAACADTLSFSPPLTAGRTSRFRWEPLKIELPIYLPTNYDPARAWPIVFYYHGAGAQPSTELYQVHTGARDFIVVGMTYLSPDDLAGTPAEQARIAANEVVVRHGLQEALAASVSFDPKAIYLAGLSKGGWLVSLMGEIDASNVAGMAIQLAGRARRNDPLESRGALADRWIYVGAGELDPNNMPARQAAGFYRMGGADVTFEEYPEIGHQPPIRAPRLTAWFEALRMRRYRDRESGQRLISWYNETLGAAMNTHDLPARYHMLSAMQEDPRLTLCSRDARERIDSAINDTRRDPAVQQIWLAERAMSKLVRQELQAIFPSDMEAIVDGWRTVARTYADTPVGKRARREIERLSGRARESEKQGAPLPTPAAPTAAE